MYLARSQPRRFIGLAEKHVARFFVIDAGGTLKLATRVWDGACCRPKFQHRSVGCVTTRHAGAYHDWDRRPVWGNSAFVLMALPSTIAGANFATTSNSGLKTRLTILGN
jgi:hypothetical protein